MNQRNVAFKTFYQTFISLQYVVIAKDVLIADDVSTHSVLFTVKNAGRVFCARADWTLRQNTAVIKKG